MDEKKVDAVRDWAQTHSAHESPTKETQITHLDPNCPASLRHTQTSLHYLSPPRSPRPRAPLCHRGRRLNHRVGGVRPVTAAGEATETPSMCFLFTQTQPSRKRIMNIGNRELLAIKFALEEWRHWLEGAKHPFTVLTDHKNLEYLRAAKRLNPRQARWAPILHPIQLHFIVPPRIKEHQGRRPVSSS
ncbi:hypothetical protein QTP70_009578 [Hemibagrus guttatus]|uniref:Reverse transcriptase RNase H-like domain-containing protein n=1 Tax=Hemibagrus guttatus TaxID=175788 RepID=A0AAE0R9I2_9TELE|nr:hypothetical protein QTP70_009578 [Hemibagrus guttatus]